MIEMECNCALVDIRIWIIFDMDKGWLDVCGDCLCCRGKDENEDDGESFWFDGSEFGDVLDSLKKGVEFCEEYSNVTKEQAIKLLEIHQELYGDGTTCAELYGRPLN